MSTTPVIAGSAGASAPDSSRLSNRANLEKAAQQFESVFIGMMLKSMRQAQDTVGGGLFDNDASKQFRDMADAKLAQDMGGKGTLGIAKAMVDYMSRNRPDLQPQAPKAETGK